MTLATNTPWESSATSTKIWRSTRRHAQSLRRLRILLAVVLVICFWYSVPYQLPLQLDADPVKAAANEAEAFQGNLSRQVAMPALLALCALGLRYLPARQRIQKSRLLWWVLAYFAWAVSSVLWSADPSLTAKRLLVFGIDATVAFTLAKLLSLEELAILGFTATAVVACLALWADVVLLHAFQPANPDYRFMGVMTANYQAMNLFVCLTCGVTLLSIRPRIRRWLGPMLLLLASLLFLTRARIGAILFALVFAITALRYTRRHLRPHTQVVLFLLLICCLAPPILYAVANKGADAITAVFMMGRHDTENTSNLSNRAPLWAELTDSVRQEPLLGVGFDAFWSPERVQKVSLDQGWVVPHAHNTYLDQVLSLGLIGGFFYLGAMSGAYGVAWGRYRRRPDPLQLLPLLLLGWVMLLGLSESLPLSPYLPTLLAYSCVARMCMHEEEVSKSKRAVTGDARMWIEGGTTFWSQPKPY